VEDDFTMRSLLQTLLELEGFEVLAFEGGSGQFIEKCAEFNPHFILIDYHLKIGSGLELLSQLRANYRQPSPRVLMLSGEDHRNQCLKAGADGFILKPFMPDELIGWLHEREKSLEF